MEKEIKQTWQFSQPIQEVWDYLTKPELIEQWMMKSDFKPIVGHKFQFTFDAKPGSIYEGIVNCEVLLVKPYTDLSYTWNGRTADGTRSFHSTVSWALAPKDGGTELQLLHNGLDILEDILNHTNGWNSCGKKLDAQINTVRA